MDCHNSSACSATLRGSAKSASASWRRIASGTQLRNNCSKSILRWCPSSRASISSIRTEGILSPRSPIWRSLLARTLRVSPKVFVWRVLMASYWVSRGGGLPCPGREQRWYRHTWFARMLCHVLSTEPLLAGTTPEVGRSIKWVVWGWQHWSQPLCSKRRFWRSGSQLKWVTFDKRL